MLVKYLRKKMTLSLQNFNKALSEAEQLLACFETLNNHPELCSYDVLKKASLIMTLTAWETYVEDVVTEIFDAKFSLIKGSQFGHFAEKQLQERLKYFHNPNSNKTKKLFEEFFGVDVTEQWSWPNVLPKDAREQLNKWISKRGEAVHRAQLDITQPQIIKKDELEKCLRFFKALAQATDKALAVI